MHPFAMTPGNSHIKSPRELIVALQSGKYRKTKGQFRRTVLSDLSPQVTSHYCCLGVYAELCGISTPEEQAIFEWGSADSPLINKRRLPEGHWLLTRVNSYHTLLQFQNVLTELNDHNETFAEVIEALERFDAGERDFSNV